MNIEELKKKYLGMHIPIIESITEQTFSKGIREIKVYHLSELGESIVDTFKNEVDSEFRVRVWLPGTIGTMDYRLDRVNLKINKDGIVSAITIG